MAAETWPLVWRAAQNEEKAADVQNKEFSSGFKLFQSNLMTELLCVSSHTQTNLSAQEALNKHKAFPKA